MIECFLPFHLARSLFACFHRNPAPDTHFILMPKRFAAAMKQGWAEQDALLGFNLVLQITHQDAEALNPLVV